MSSTQEAGDIFGQGGGPAHAMLRSPTVLIASVGLWGMNVFFFRLFRIDYVRILRNDLIKLEEQEHDDYERRHHHHHHHHHKEMDFYDDSCYPPSRSSQQQSQSQQQQQQQQSVTRTQSSSDFQSPQQQLIQRQPSNNGVTSIASAAATVSQTAQLNTSVGEDDDEQQQQYEINLYNNHHLLDYDDSFDQDSMFDPDLAITWGKLVGLSMLLLILLHSTYFWWLNVLHGGTIGAVFMFYTLVALAITLPLRCSRWLRRATVIVLQRTYEMINPRCHCIANDGVTPPRFIPFVDVFYADAMCSLSKVFFDWGMLFHMATHYPNPVPASAHNILIPSACAAVPYIIRARQCLIMYTVTRMQKEKNRFSHLWNALKYSTSIFPLCLSAYQQTVPKHVADGLESLLVFLLVINSVFALYWDIVMDWGMMQENPVGVAFCNTGSRAKAMANPHKAAVPTSCVHLVLRPRLRFGFAMSGLILLIDCVLRFSWMLRFFKNTIFPDADSFVLGTQFLEVFRRALWNLLRVEWEFIKHSKTLSVNNADTMMLPSASNIGATVEEELKSFLPTVSKRNTK